ncbi:DNA polymerase IV [uncultured Lactobacillus sp.]|uniref:DNA polymerase IV n=1 Tax=uncultured Lactobacillus sp. TaxID=153152 RepID=UPI0028058B6E|nr:DNA polymerase IV [uncultured Lactobacillus sp.]
MNKENLLPQNDIHRRIIHLDMDAFYASVEIRRHPEYKDKALIVGMDPRQNNGHGVVATCNYVARKYGVHSAMASIQAVRLIPKEKLVFVPPDFKVYRSTSAQIHSFMHEITDRVESVALDEAYLDVTNNKVGLDSAVQIALNLQKRIRKELGLNSSFGVSYNKFLAKMGSEYAKPFGRTVILPSEAKRFLGMQKIEKFPGIGPKTQEQLHEMGVYTGADLQQVDVLELIKKFKKMGYILAQHARGIDLNPVVTDSEVNRKSIGIERTYEPAIFTEDEALSKIRSYCAYLEKELKKRNFRASTIVLKIRNNDFNTVTKRRKLTKPSDDKFDFYEIARELFESTHGFLEDGIRLLGVTATDFKKENYQAINLFEVGPKK